VLIFHWCKECNAKRFQQDFSNWTSGNEFIDKFIQEVQLNAINSEYVIEWIPYNRFKNVKYLNKGEFSTVYKAIWLDGPIQKWSYNDRKWIRCNKNYCTNEFVVALKNLNGSINLNEGFLNEVQT